MQRSEFAAVECLKASGCDGCDVGALKYKKLLAISHTHVICGMGDGFTLTTFETFQNILSVAADKDGSLGSIDTEDDNMRYICVPDLCLLSLSPCEQFIAAATTSFVFVFSLPNLLNGIYSPCSSIRAAESFSLCWNSTSDKIFVISGDVSSVISFDSIDSNLTIMHRFPAPMKIRSGIWFEEIIIGTQDGYLIILDDEYAERKRIYIGKPIYTVSTLRIGETTKIVVENEDSNGVNISFVDAAGGIEKIIPTNEINSCLAKEYWEIVGLCEYIGSFVVIVYYESVQKIQCFSIATNLTTEECIGSRLVHGSSTQLILFSSQRDLYFYNIVVRPKTQENHKILSLAPRGGDAVHHSFIGNSSFQSNNHLEDKPTYRRQSFEFWKNLEIQEEKEEAEQLINPRSPRKSTPKETHTLPDVNSSNEKKREAPEEQKTKETKELQFDVLENEDILVRAQRMKEDFIAPVKEKIPEYFRCPITQKIMQEPIIAGNISQEKEQFFANSPANAINWQTNIALSLAIGDFLEQNPHIKKSREYYLKTSDIESFSNSLKNQCVHECLECLVEEPRLFFACPASTTVLECVLEFFPPHQIIQFVDVLRQKDLLPLLFSCENLTATEWMSKICIIQGSSDVSKTFADLLHVTGNWNNFASQPCTSNEI